MAHLPIYLLHLNRGRIWKVTAVFFPNCVKKIIVLGHFHTCWHKMAKNGNLFWGENFRAGRKILWLLQISLQLKASTWMRQNLVYSPNLKVSESESDFFSAHDNKRTATTVAACGVFGIRRVRSPIEKIWLPDGISHFYWKVLKKSSLVVKLSILRVAILRIEVLPEAKSSMRSRRQPRARTALSFSTDVLKRHPKNR